MKVKVNRKNVAEQIAAFTSEKKWKESLNLIKRFKVRNQTVTKDTVRRKWHVSEKQMQQLNFIEVPNPYYSSVSAPMKLYLIAEINDAFLPTTSAN